MKTAQSILILILLVIGYSTNAQLFSIDNGHTAITSKVMRFEVVKVLGRFHTVSGTINYNATDPTKITANITILANSYLANNPEGENAVKGPSFLDVKSFPEIKVVTKSISKISVGYIAVAALTLHGVTKEVTFPIAITGPSLDLVFQKKSIGITGVLTINRLDYGIGPTAKLPTGGMIIGNEVEIGINALAIEQ